MMVATAIVLMMTIPGLALFYAGMVRKKNVLATMSLAATALVSILWIAFGYSLAFTGEGAWLGSADRLLLRGLGMDSISALAQSIPEALFMLYQMTFAIITVALVAGAVADRMRFSAFMLFLRCGWPSRRFRSRIGSGAAASLAAPVCLTLPAARWCT
jgi:ammonium transporter, Amt family